MMVIYHVDHANRTNDMTPCHPTIAIAAVWWRYGSACLILTISGTNVNTRCGILKKFVNDQPEYVAR